MVQPRTRPGTAPARRVPSLERAAADLVAVLGALRAGPGRGAVDEVPEPDSCAHLAKPPSMAGLFTCDCRRRSSAAAALRIALELLLRPPAAVAASSWRGSAAAHRTLFGAGGRTRA